MPGIITVPETHIKNPGKRITELCRESGSIEIGIAEHLAAEDRESSSGSPYKGEMIRVGNIRSFHSPQKTLGRVPPDHDLV